MLKFGAGPWWKSNLCSTVSMLKTTQQCPPHPNPAPSSSLREVTVSIIRHLGSSTQPAALLSGQTGFTAALASYPAVAHVPLFSLLSVGWLLCLKSTINSLRCTHTLLHHLCHIRGHGVSTNCAPPPALSSCPQTENKTSACDCFSSFSSLSHGTKKCENETVLTLVIV